MSVPLPDAQTRWRCSVCGNLTRFDVLRSSRTQEYVHVDLSGEPTVEEREVLTESADQVTCRWCGSVDRIELVPVQAPDPPSTARKVSEVVPSVRTRRRPARGRRTEVGAGHGTGSGRHVDRL